MDPYHIDFNQLESHTEVEDCKNVDAFDEMGQSSLIVTLYGYNEETQVD